MATSTLTEQDLTTESYREYDFGGRIYVIDSPVKLYFRPGGSTHRVVDAKGVVHCVPAPGEKGCVIRWMNKAGSPQVSF
jgi:hypothetical protein